MPKELEKDVLITLKEWIYSLSLLDKPTGVEKYPLFNNFPLEEQKLLIQEYNKIISEKVLSESLYVNTLYAGIKVNFDSHKDLLDKEDYKEYLDNEINPSDFGLSIPKERQKSLNERVVSMLFGLS